jgi:hypothetical protein
MARAATYELDPKVRETLERLRVALDASSHTVVIHQAITLLRYAVDTTQARGHVILRREDGTEREIVMG